MTDDELVEAMLAHPVLIKRPLVVPPLGVKVCRPLEGVLDLLPALLVGDFVQGDGEVIRAATAA